MKTPTGQYLLEILINLLADQEGVEIKYELEDGGGTDVRRVS